MNGRKSKAIRRMLNVWCRINRVKRTSRTYRSMKNVCRNLSIKQIRVIPEVFKVTRPERAF